ncbi:response regulator transcription factor [Panacibacter ginsenosidivorans]|uniref:Response regulator transcription factor n=1 Tax=Panacibacter ginsenosidivorans TaxID=1813871 RepID=A0A5B8V343_9BACT|nr:response regulator transcription factor [Panacibacter ginsenosidivorans]QEC65840.1 response regulator transcription factor [Panacibacter ginsenosidivorans]
MKLLVIEDEVALSNSICDFLNSENFMCETAYDFHVAMEKIALYEYACIILDITLPGGSGLEILKELKKENKADGVLIISAKNSLDDKVLGLKTGADDYLTKPFHLPELGARVHAIIRRKSFGGMNVIQFDELTLNLQNKTVKAADKLIDLTRKEYELLLYFISNKNKVISKGAIAEHLWGDNMDLADNYDFIYTHIKNLRKKIMQNGCPDYIISVYGMGYKLMVPSVK